MILADIVKDLTVVQKCKLRFEHKEVKSYSNHTPAMIARLSKFPLSKVKMLVDINLDEWDEFLHPESYCRWVDEQFGRSFGDSARDWEKRRMSRKVKILSESAPVSS